MNKGEIMVAFALSQLDRVTPRQNVLTASTGDVELTYAKSPIREADEVRAILADLTDT